MFGEQANIGQSISILLVEDEPRYLDSTRLLLNHYVNDIETALTGQHALALLASRSFDIALLDLGLPDMTGLEVMSEIRAKWPDIMVIVVSGDPCIDSVIESLRLGAYDYLRKPYEPEELIKTINHTRQKIRLENENRHYYQMLQHSENLHRLLVNNSPDIIYTLDPQGRFTFLNDSAKKILGLETGAMIGKDYEHIVFHADLDLAKHALNDRRTGARATQNRELRFRRRNSVNKRDDGYVTIELNAMGLYRTTQDGTSEFIGTYGVARDIEERKKAEATIKFQAYHDLLTNLPNRTLFKDRLKQAMVQSKRKGNFLAVMFLDLDHFKMVNDTLGHLIGDELLQAVAQRLRNCIREGDTLARIGGDEFLLLLPDIHGRENSEGIAQKIVASFKTPFHIEEHELYVSISIGIAIFPDDGEMIDTLIKHADIAMYHAKDRGRNDYCFFAAALDNSVTGRLDIQTGLRHALQRGELDVYYQPQVNIATGRIVGMEALVRWNHPEKGMIPPADFIQIAEESGLINPISEWVLQTACRQARAWQNMLIPSITLAVNLSARQIEHPEFVKNFTQILNENNLDGSSIEIEITESTLMRDIEGCVSKLKELNELGVIVSIDDFGTGYSSLSYLKKLPIHTLKIDQSFIHDLKSDSQGASIVDGITAMAKGLHLNVIAEGVESGDQLEYLRNSGCDAYQGFHFSRPVNSGCATNMLQAEMHHIA
jgi:diguanylate cyclase (GGDEF)-like protein/PAS domain S-box-containing protein